MWEGVVVGWLVVRGDGLRYSRSGACRCWARPSIGDNLVRDSPFGEIEIFNPVHRPGKVKHFRKPKEPLEGGVTFASASSALLIEQVAPEICSHV